jgi:hypothetical protein
MASQGDHRAGCYSIPSARHLPGQRGLHFMDEIVHNVGSRSRRAPLHAQRTHDAFDHLCEATPGSDQYPYGYADGHSMVRGDASVNHTGALAPLIILAAEDALYE